TLCVISMKPVCFAFSSVFKAHRPKKGPFGRCKPIGFYRANFSTGALRSRGPAPSGWARGHIGYSAPRLARVSAGDVTLEGLNSLLLAGDHPFDQVPDGD